MNYENKMDSKLLPETRHKVRSDNPFVCEIEELSFNYAWNSKPSCQDAQKHVYEIFPQQGHFQDVDAAREESYQTTFGYSQDLGEYVTYPQDLTGYSETMYDDQNEHSYTGQIHQ